MQGFYFLTANARRNFRELSWRLLIEGVRLTWGQLNTSFSLLAKQNNTRTILTTKFQWTKLGLQKSRTWTFPSESVRVQWITSISRPFSNLHFRFSDQGQGDTTGICSTVLDSPPK